MTAEPAPLLALLRRRIDVEGPLTIATYMADCLGHPIHGYYRMSDPLGARGDFITAPEVSQMFGELIGLWCADLWQRLGAPDPVRLVELGPGRGTLMADALRAARLVPGFRAAIRLHLVETGLVFRRLQAAALAGSGLDPQWHDHWDQVPDDAPTLVIANEFFDALPIRQFQQTEQGWAERCVAADAEGPGLRLILGRATPAIANLIPAGFRDAASGTIVEVAPAALATAAALADRIARRDGGALVIDYGYCRSAPGDTWQALRRHHPVSPLDGPGTADLTAHVDFQALGDIARLQAATVHGPVEQGAFLAALGIRQRAARLRQAGAPDIDAALDRLIAPDQMGSLFKVMALTAPGRPVPAGFSGSL
ncbi:MAG: SAM-dependent methyltransferase [Azospirillaceae bacterium]|nr:SAM-dependent methyltransferase [Azospirillaceae bacterium]